MKTKDENQKPGWLGNSLCLLKARKLLILRSAPVATTARNARVGYTLGTLAVTVPLLNGKQTKHVPAACEGYRNDVLRELASNPVEPTSWRIIIT